MIDRLTFKQVSSQLLLLLYLTLFTVSCARIGSPSGGPKDMNPPITISAEPNFGSTNFKGQKIKILFDEYIKFKDLRTQLIISPPLNYEPEISPMGMASKSITIKIKDTLKENTTYTFNFGNAIVDNTEGNVLKQFKYVFSTGDYVDSLQIKGEVKYCLTAEKPKNIMVMLYEIDSLYNDSIIYKSKPNYITNTLDSTYFNITNVRQGSYKLIAVEDFNNNMIYDPRQDNMAFNQDNVTLPLDTVFSLNIFKEKPSFKVVKAIQNGANKLWIAYEGDWQDSIASITDSKDNLLQYISYKSTQQDSIDIWFKNAVTDTLFVNLVGQKDTTLSVNLRPTSKPLDSLEIRSSVVGILHPRDSLFITSNIPIVKIDKTLVSFIDKDSTEVNFEIKPTQNPLKKLIDFKRSPENTYRINILPNAFVDYFEQANDTISLGVATDRSEDYGEIILNLQTEKPVVVKLLDRNQEVVDVKYESETKDLIFKQLVPGKYSFQIIIDDNNNKQWDTGSFLKNAQPERIIYLEEEIDLRANWTVNESITIN